MLITAYPNVVNMKENNRMLKHYLADYFYHAINLNTEHARF